jgi:hypothetical protein
VGQREPNPAQIGERRGVAVAKERVLQRAGTTPAAVAMSVNVIGRPACSSMNAIARRTVAAVDGSRGVRISVVMVVLGNVVSMLAATMCSAAASTSG